MRWRLSPELAATEDLVILIADMLMSSSHTGQWKFQYVIMDSDNPRDPQRVNHVILAVDIASSET